MSRKIECDGIRINVFSIGTSVQLSHADSQLAWVVDNPREKYWVVSHTVQIDRYQTLHEVIKVFADYVQKNESLAKKQRATKERIRKAIQSLPTEC